MLSTVGFDSFSSAPGNGGLVVLSAVPADLSYRPGSRERIPVTLTSTGGDSETVRLWSYACGEAPRIYVCEELELHMRSGFRAESLRTSLDQIPARFIVVSVSGSVAGVRVFDPDDADRAIMFLRAQPGVQDVFHSILLFTTAAPSSSAANPIADLSGAVSFDLASPVRGDRHVQARSGDTLRASYLQPDGSRLTSERVVP
jgi:hypothetical protein